MDKSDVVPRHSAEFLIDLCDEVGEGGWRRQAFYFEGLSTEVLNRKF